ncbi:M23 family metallopeptidase [Dactylosporangium cerinum]|uniref:M23 family metallopeptidase n=1 Tax=Dactylosporangium cerinum TaxID=1434730 RepID=A0ABV9VZU8_9ACTN
MTDRLPVIAEVRDRLLSAYRASPLECTSVAIASLDHLAKRYHRSRQLLPGQIDCSTLVSQAHWDGAAVQTPFIAENQRTARSAAVVAGLADALPGDVLVAYASLEAAPGGRHNHVALVLESDGQGDGWAIQASESAGTQIIRLTQARLGGGIRRFCPNPLVVYAAGDWAELVRRVPKLGRLGVRLKQPWAAVRRHSGVDVAVEHGTPIRASIGGTVSLHKSEASIVVRDEQLRLTSALLPVVADPRLADGDTVARGDVLGTSAPPVASLPCDPTVSSAARPHVHWELWSDAPMGYHPSVTVAAPAGFSDPGYRAYSPVYAVKLGKVGSPLPPGRS